MERLAPLGEDDPEMGDWMRGKEGLVFACSGHLQRARIMSQHAIELARQKGRQEAAAQHEAAAAVREILFGNTHEARRLALSARRSANGREAVYGSALALAFAGDSVQSQKVADDLGKRFPKDTLVNFNYLPTVRALLALNHGQPLKAVELLQAASPYELGYLSANSVGFAGSLYPIYVRGVAYLKAQRGSDAAAEFQRILSHRGIIFADPIEALARLQLGRAYRLAGDEVKARTAYEDFLARWRDADADIPALKQAKSEYAKLQRDRARAFATVASF
jgi:predicted Zn-dependent protease